MPLFKPRSKKAHESTSKPADEGKPASIAEAIRRKSSKAGAMEHEARDHAELEESADLQDSENSYPIQVPDVANEDETYFDLGQISEQPMDSNEHGDKLSDADEHNAGMIASIMRKMRASR